MSDTSLDSDTRRQVAYSLGQIDPAGSQNALTIVSLVAKTSFNNFQLFNNNENLLNLIWRCSENLPYPEFYQAWHENNPANNTYQNLDPSNLPQILAEAINKEIKLQDKVQLIYIDGSKFIDRDNPAAKIYTEMVKQGCSKSEDGTPKDMLELQTYWDLLESEKLVVLVFYENPTKRKRFSKVFLDALDTFDGAICVITEQPLEDMGLKFFDTNRFTKDVVEWIIQSY